MLLVGDRPSLFLASHELSHFLGTLDMYGRWGIDSLHFRCTLMGPTVGGADALNSVHLDAWHKLQLGWVEPQIYSINSRVIPVLPASNTPFADSAIILYDPARGFGEYFLLEYRAPTLPDFPHDRDACGTPSLRWLDGTQTNTCIAVRGFTPGDSSIVLDVYQGQGTEPCGDPGRIVGPTPPTPNPCQMLRNMITAQNQVIALLRKQLLRATSPSETERLHAQLDTELVQLAGLYEDLGARGCKR